MRVQNEERRPVGDPDGAKTSAKKSVHTVPADTVNLALLTPAEFAIFESGYSSGYVAGIERGRQLEEEDIARLQRQAALIVHTLAKAPVVTTDLSPEARERGRQESIRAFREDYERRRAGMGGDR